MRMNRGQPFLDTEADYRPDDWPSDKRLPPTFSEAFLYPAVGKGDARFILGVADEYDHVIQALGPKATKRILDVKPRLAQRLGLAKAVKECLEDAASDEFERRESLVPSQVVLDQDAAQHVWRILHEEYCRHFDPEEDLERDSLRAYDVLTDGLGPYYREERQKERDRLPEKLERQEKRRVELEERKQRRRGREELVEKILVRRAGMDEKQAKDAAFLAVSVLAKELAA